MSILVVVLIVLVLVGGTGWGWRSGWYGTGTFGGLSGLLLALLVLYLVFGGRSHY